MPAIASATDNGCLEKPGRRLHGWSRTSTSNDTPRRANPVGQLLDRRPLVADAVDAARGPEHGHPEILRRPWPYRVLGCSRRGVVAAAVAARRRGRRPGDGRHPRQAGLGRHVAGSRSRRPPREAACRRVGGERATAATHGRPVNGRPVAGSWSKAAALAACRRVGGRGGITLTHGRPATAASRSTGTHACTSPDGPSPPTPGTTDASTTSTPSPLRSASWSGPAGTKAWMTTSTSPSDRTWTRAVDRPAGSPPPPSDRTVSATCLIESATLPAEPSTVAPVVVGTTPGPAAVVVVIGPAATVDVVARFPPGRTRRHRRRWRRRRPTPDQEHSHRQGRPRGAHVRRSSRRGRSGCPHRFPGCRRRRRGRP